MVCLLFDDCQKQVYARGLCRNHHAFVSRLVAKGIRTWEELVRYGMAAPHYKIGDNGRKKKSILYFYELYQKQPRKIPDVRHCVLPECTSEVFSRGLCTRHDSVFRYYQGRGMIDMKKAEEIGLIPQKITSSERIKLVNATKNSKRIAELKELLEWNKNN